MACKGQSGGCTIQSSPAPCCSFHKWLLQRPSRLVSPEASRVQCLTEWFPQFFLDSEFWILVWSNFTWCFPGVVLQLFDYIQSLKSWARRSPLLQPSETTSWNTHRCCVTLCMACNVQPFTWRTGSMDCCLGEIFWMFRRILAALTMKHCKGNLVFQIYAVRAFISWYDASHCVEHTALIMDQIH